ncbi:hypothetical protein niasHT_014435 [Heterodera trifolii]|uniref:Uncharacterized protein n=1 Tax=Heterodera trifolii TaxID=157864 RepID=A0ABD2KZE9_9BILA
MGRGRERQFKRVRSGGGVIEKCEKICASSDARWWERCERAAPACVPATLVRRDRRGKQRSGEVRGDEAAEEARLKEDGQNTGDCVARRRLGGGMKRMEKAREKKMDKTRRTGRSVSGADEIPPPPQNVVVVVRRFAVFVLEDTPKMNEGGQQE